MLYQHYPAQCGSPGLLRWDVEVLDFVDRIGITSMTVGNPGDGKPGNVANRYLRLVERSFGSLISDAESYLTFPVSRKGIDQQYLLRDASNIALTSDDIDHLVRRAKMLHTYVASANSLESMQRITREEPPHLPLDPLGSDPVTMPFAGAVRLYVASCYQLRHLLRYRIADLVGSHDHQQRKFLEEWEKSTRRDVDFKLVFDARLKQVEQAAGIEPPAVDDKDDLDSLRRRYFDKLNALRNPRVNPSIDTVEQNPSPPASDETLSRIRAERKKRESKEDGKEDSTPSNPSDIIDKEVVELEKRSSHLLSSLTKLREMLDQWDLMQAGLRGDAYLSTDGHLYRKQFRPPHDSAKPDGDGDNHSPKGT